MGEQETCIPARVGARSRNIDKAGGFRLAALLGAHRRRCQSEVRATNSVSDTDSTGGSIVCRCGGGHRVLSRNNSNQSAQSSATIQTQVTASSSSQRDGRSYERNSTSSTSRFDDLGDELVIPEKEMNSFQKQIPGLKRHDAKTSTIRQHYYPEGGWGWLICGCGFIIQMLTTGLQYSFGILYTELIAYVGEDKAIAACWVGSTSLALSRAAVPFVVALCRRKSTRLTAVIGGLVMALALLFTSFAVQLHQIFFSWGLLLGAGMGMTRETANLMVGQYFKRRREFVEIIVQSGCGIGITLFSVFFKEAIRNTGWRFGLQAVTGVVFSAFFIGIFYRSASLYHPQRRAILHLKNQKRKQVKDRKKVDTKPPYFDLSCLQSKSIRLLLVSAGLSSVGLYTPIFYLILSASLEGLEDSSLILLQTFLGFAYAIGCISFGVIIVRQSEQCMISRQYLCQAALFGLGVCILALTAIQGYYGYVLFMWLYGVLLGGAHYSLQMLTLEKARARHFSRAWGFVQGATSVSILIGVPVTGYINESNPKTGYFFASFFTLAGASSLFLFKYYKDENSKADTSVSFTTVDSQISAGPAYNMSLENGSGRRHMPQHSQTMPLTPICTCGADPCVFPLPPPPCKKPGLNKLEKTISFATSVDVIDPEMKPELLTCISEEGLLDHYCEYTGNCLQTCSKSNNFCQFEHIDNQRPVHYGSAECHCTGAIVQNHSARRLQEASMYNFQGHPNHHQYRFSSISRKPPSASRVPSFPILRQPKKTVTLLDEITTSV